MTTEATTATNKTLGINEIKEYLPHRYPLLLVDRVVDYELGKTITAIKNVTVNEEFFNGHFPHKPVMPGVLMIEALAQTAAILSFMTMNVKPCTSSASTMRASSVRSSRATSSRWTSRSCAPRAASGSTRLSPASTARSPSKLS